MEKLRAIIIDDELKGIQSLELLIEKFCPDVKLVATTIKANEAIDLIENYRPDIVFLDIQMPFLNGFELLEKLSHRDFSLIFTTAFAQYALKAIKNNAVDYLLKPIDIDDLRPAIEKVKNKKETGELKNINWQNILTTLVKDVKRLAIPTTDGILYEPYENIIRLESDSNYTTIYLTGNRKEIVPKTLKEFEDVLCQQHNQFMRIHNSHIINLNYVIRYLKENNGRVVMSDEAVLNISRAKKDEFITWLSI